MSTSTIIFLSAVGCGLLFGACAWIAEMGPDPATAANAKKAGKKGKQVPAPTPPRRRRPRWVLPVLVFAGCTAFGGLAFLIDDGVADETLFEVVAEGTGPSVPQTFPFEIPVEHPEVEHELLVEPKSTIGVVDLRVQVIDPAGRVLLDRTETLEGTCEEFCEPRAFSATFTPTRAGLHTLQVTVATPDVGELHVHVGDPEKTDGRRAPGY
jgi:hypothetical protein